MTSEPVVGVALGGGAARGLAHIGVLRALEELGLLPGVIGGTSIGALVGSLYAWQGSAGDAERAVRAFLISPEFLHMRLRFLRPEASPAAGSLFYSFSNLVKKGIVLGYSVARPSFVSAEEFAGYIAALLPDLDIDELALPMVVVAADLNTGLEVTLSRGRLRPAVAGSCAIPGLLPPAPVDGRLLIDGGWVNKVPVRPVRSLGADLVIAVDVSVDLEDTSGFKRGLNIMTRANAIAANRLRELQVAEADVVIRPRVSRIHWADFSCLDQAIELGREAVHEVRADLTARLARRRQLLAMRAFAARDRAEP